MGFGTKEQWICDPEHDGKPMRPVTAFVHEFNSPTAGEATLTISALGIFEAHINGQTVSDEIFAPGWNDFRFFSEYRIYSKSVRVGINHIEILLADGWFAGTISGGFYGKPPAVIARLDYPGGTLVTGPDWQCSADGPWLFSDIYMGEYFDSRRSWQNWHSPHVITPDITIVPFSGSPVRRIERIEPVSVNGNIVDFGQNLTGREELAITASAGAKITIRHAEALDHDGSLYVENLRAATSENIFIASGGTTVFEPKFTFHGFRYIEVSGADSFTATAYVIHSDFPFHCSFECSNPRLNQLFQNIIWGWRGNALDIPTDCPQRDERCGWLGDAQVFIRAAHYLSDSGPFFRRWLHTVVSGRDEQGAYTSVAPFVPRFGEIGGEAGWADAGIICPWEHYQFYRNPAVLEENYEAMIGFVRSRLREAPNFISTRASFGDWLNSSACTSKALLATAFFAHSADLVARIALILNKNADATEMTELFEKIRSTFWDRFGNEINTQTAAVLALEFDLVPVAERQSVADFLAHDVTVTRSGHLSTGFLGTPLLLHALSNNGHLATAWQLLEQTSCPSWLFPVIHGATTVWERWDSWTPEKGFAEASMNSFNHYAYGAVLDWIIGVAAGIKPDFSIDPQPGGSLTQLKAEFRGLKVEWRRRDDKVFYKIIVPPGITARFRNTTLNEGKHQIEEDYYVRN